MKPEANGETISGAAAYARSTGKKRRRAVTALVFASFWTPAACYQRRFVLPETKHGNARDSCCCSRGKVFKISFFIHNFMSALAEAARERAATAARWCSAAGRVRAGSNFDP